MGLFLFVYSRSQTKSLSNTISRPSGFGRLFLECIFLPSHISNFFTSHGIIRPEEEEERDDDGFLLDLMFMYVMMVVAVVTCWGLRHGDVTHHVYPTVITVGFTLILAEVRMWLSYGWFWGIFSTIYAVILISNAVFMSMYGVWSFCKFFAVSSRYSGT